MELFEIELFDLCVNKFLMFNWIVIDTKQYFKQTIFVYFS